MEESTRLTRQSHRSSHHRADRPVFGNDECSTDSGCSSGGSSGSVERLSHHGSGERLCGGIRSHYYLDRLRGRPTSTKSQERLSRTLKSTGRVRAKSSRSWSPSNVRESSQESPSQSPSSSDAHSSDSDSLKRPSTMETLRKAFQSLIVSSKKDSKEKKRVKKGPKRILRSPVSYSYVRGLSGLPTQRVPRNVAQ